MTASEQRLVAVQRLMADHNPSQESENEEEHLKQVEEMDGQKQAVESLVGKVVKAVKALNDVLILIASENTFYI